MSELLTDIVSSWRTAAELTQSEAAARIGTPQAASSRVESGTRFPDRSTARMFIDAGVFTAEQYGRAMVADVMRSDQAA